MKKLFFAVPVVVGAAAIAGTAQYASTETKSEYHQLVAQLNDLSPLVFVNEQYDAGLTNSYAVTKVLASRTADAEVLFRLQHDIRHAPVRMGDDGIDVANVSIDTRLHNDASLSPELAAAFGDAAPFLLKTHVSYSGEISNHLNVSAVKVAEEGGEFLWTGLNFEGITRDGTTVGKGSVGAVSFSDTHGGGMLNVEDSPFEIDVQYHGDGVFTGKGDMKLEKISLLNPDMPVPVSMQSIELSSNTDMKGDVLNSNTLLKVRGIESPLPLNNVSLDTQMNGIVLEGLRQYNKATMAALKNDADALVDDPDLISDISSGLIAMFAPGSAMKYTLAMDNGEGDVNADIRLAVKDASADGMSADIMKSIATGRDLLNILTLEGSLDADTAALAQTPVMMMLGGAGEFITVTDESVKSQVSLDGTMLNVNGVELPLDTMFGFMLDVPFSDLASM
ncbi:MAG: DUF945 family protein [Granulosicoccus sp.]